MAMASGWRNVSLPALAALALGVIPAPAPAQPLAADTQWKDPSEVRLEVDFPGQGYHASWQLFRCDCGDLLIRSELSEPGEAVQGEIVLVANRAVLTRGFGKEAAELASVDAPALMLQLALRLLQRAEPGGPSAVVARREVAVEDRINYINLDTGTAVGGFPAPWSVSGALWPAGESKRHFDLRFKFNAGGAAGAEAQQGELRLSGYIEFARRPFPLESDLPLQGWTLGWHDPDDPLAGKSDAATTLAELRRLVRESPR
jgi:hypothetical protein